MSVPGPGSGDPARCQSPVLGSGDPARDQPPVRGSGDPARCQSPVLGSGNPARDQPPVRAQGILPGVSPRSWAQGTLPGLSPRSGAQAILPGVSPAQAAGPLNSVPGEQARSVARSRPGARLPGRLRAPAGPRAQIAAHAEAAVLGNRADRAPVSRSPAPSLPPAKPAALTLSPGHAVSRVLTRFKTARRLPQRTPPARASHAPLSR